MSKILSFIVMLPRSVLWVLACLQGGKWRNTHSKRNLQKEEAIALDRRAEAQLVGWYDEYNENGRWDGRTGVYEYEVDGKKHRTEVYRSSGKLEETHIVYYRKDGIDCDAINTSALKYKALWGVLLIGDFFGMTGISLLPFIYFLDLERRFKTRLSTVNAQRTTLHDVGSKHYATYSYTVGEKVFTYYFCSKVNTPPQELTLYYKKWCPQDAWSDLSDVTVRKWEVMKVYGLMLLSAYVMNAVFNLVVPLGGLL